MRALRILPEADGKGHQLQGDIVHHEREQGLVRVIARFAVGGNETPDHAKEHAADKHQEEEQRIRQFSAEKYHKSGARNAADQDLSLRADVPEAHAEGRRESDRD